VNLQQIAGLSAEGRASSARVQALVLKKQNEAAAKTKQLQDNQTKLQQSGSLLSEAARAQLEKDIERQNVEGQRFQQDAQAEINELQQQLQSEFQRKLGPVLESLAKDKGLHALFSAADAGLIWADPGLDLTAEAIKKLDAATVGASTAPAAPVAPAAPAATPKP
jgi:outer membrane protein